MLGHGSEIAARNAVAANVSFFEMSHLDRQHVAVPLRRRKTTPRVRRVGRGVRASIQVINVINGTQPFGMKSGDLPRHGIHFLRYAQLGGAAPDVIGRMRPALPFRHTLD